MKRIIDFIASKAFRKAMKMFLVWIVIFAIFIFAFIKFIYYIGDNLPVVKEPVIKEVQKGLVDVSGLRIEEEEKPIVGNLSVT